MTRPRAAVMLPKGNSPVQTVNPVREKVNMISTITNQGETHFMFYSETMTAQLLIQFMERLIRQNEWKVYLILDNLRVHHSKTLSNKPLGRAKGKITEHAKYNKTLYLETNQPDQRFI